MQFNWDRTSLLLLRAVVVKFCLNHILLFLLHVIIQGVGGLSSPSIYPGGCLAALCAISGTCNVRSPSFSWFNLGLSVNQTTINWVAAVSQIYLTDLTWLLLPWTVEKQQSHQRSHQTQHLAHPSMVWGERDPSQCPQKVTSRTSTAGSQPASSSCWVWHCTNTKWEIAPALKRPQPK